MSDVIYQWGCTEEPVILPGLHAAFQTASLHPSPGPAFALSHPVQALWTGEKMCAGRTGAVSELEGCCAGLGELWG